MHLTNPFRHKALDRLVPFGIKAVLLAWLVAACIVLFDLADGSLYLGDVDDDLRKLQIEHLISSGNWFDTRLPMIAMPEPYFSPWSRIVDLPYVLIAKALSYWIGLEAASQLAYWAWPLLMLAVFCLLLLQIVSRMLPPGGKLSGIAIAAMLLSMSLSIWEFSPGRVDHHNFQLLISMLIFLGLLMWSPRGAVICAVGIVLSVAIGLELLPIIALILLAICLAWVVDRQGSSVFFRYVSFSVVVVVPAVALPFLGLSGLFSTQCDAFSAPYAAALLGYGLIGAAAVTLCEGMSARTRLLVLAGGGILLLLGLAILFPVCLGGPYHMIDPLSRSLWLDRVWQEHSILIFFREGYFPQLFLIAAMALIVIVATPGVWRDWNAGRTGLTIVYLVVLSTLLLTVLQTRYIRFPVAFASLLLPMLLATLRDTPQLIGRLAVSASFVLGALGLALHLSVPVHLRALDEVDFLSFGACEDADLSALGSLPPGRIMATMALGLNIAAHLPDGVTTAGISFHRSSPGMKRIIQAFLSQDPQTRREALLPFDYVAICRFNLPRSVVSSSLFSVLTLGGDWPGLLPLNTADDGPLVIYKIDHAKLQ